MGCGQSKIHLYPRKSKTKANGKKGGHVDTDADADEEEGHIEEGEKNINREKDKNEDDMMDQHSEKDITDQANGEISVSLLRAKNLSLLQSQEISTSQQNFFRMLDRKIEDGPDYDSASETEIALEEARLNALVQHWESASLTASMCSSASRSLQTTPVRQLPIRQPPPPLVRTAVQNLIPQQPLSADLLPHSTPPQSQTHGGGLMMLQHQQAPQSQQLPPPTPSTQQQQLIMSQMQMNPQLVHQMSPHIAHQMQPVASTQEQQMQLSLLMAISGSPQTVQMTNISPKRALINSNTQQQQQQQLLHQGYAVPPASQNVISGGNRSPRPAVNVGPNSLGSLPSHMHVSYYGQPQAQPLPSTGQPQTQQQQQQSPYFGDVLYPIQAAQAPPEYRFPPAISVQRLAPQVQRQLRETQELIKDSCPQLYAAGYGSPGPPLRTQPRNASRRPTLETQFSQELS